MSRAAGRKSLDPLREPKATTAKSRYHGHGNAMKAWGLGFRAGPLNIGLRV